jgi:hypothetical protein
MQARPIRRGPRPHLRLRIGCCGSGWIKIVALTGIEKLPPFRRIPPAGFQFRGGQAIESPVPGSIRTCRRKASARNSISDAQAFRTADTESRQSAGCSVHPLVCPTPFRVWGLRLRGRCSTPRSWADNSYPHCIKVCDWPATFHCRKPQPPQTGLRTAGIIHTATPGSATASTPCAPDKNRKRCRSLRQSRPQAQSTRSTALSPNR